MIKDYLGEIEYPSIEEEDQKRKIKKRKLPTKKKMQDLVKQFRSEIEDMQSGSSKLVSYPIHLSKGTCPAIKALDLLDKEPSEENMKMFIQTANQDFGWLAAKHFAYHISTLWPKASKWIGD